MDVSATLRFKPCELKVDLAELQDELWTLPHIETIKLFPVYTLSDNTNRESEPYQIRIEGAKESIQYCVIRLDEPPKRGSIPKKKMPESLQKLASYDYETLKAYFNELLECLGNNQVISWPNAATITQIKHLLFCHPNIKSLGIETGSPLKAEQVEPMLYNNRLTLDNLKRFGEQNGLRSLTEWLKRKSIHAIMGDRSTEVSEIFDNSYPLNQHYSQTQKALGSVKAETVSENEEVNSSFKKIIQMHKNGVYPPYEFCVKQRRSEWMVPKQAEELVKNWRRYSEPRLEEIQRKIEVFSELHRKFSVVIEARKVSLLKYLQVRLGRVVADWVDQLVAKGDYEFEVYELLAIGTSSRLMLNASLRSESVLPLELAIKHNKLNAFKALMHKGADIFANERILQMLFIPGHVSGVFRYEATKYLINMKTQKSELDSSKIDPDFPVEYQASFSSRQDEILCSIRAAYIDYMIQSLPLRINKKVSEKIFSIMALRGVFRWVTNTRTVDRLKQIYELNHIIYSGSLYPHLVEKKLDEKVKTLRTGIFNQKKSGHFVTKIIHAVNTFKIADQQFKVVQKIAYESSDRLKCEIAERDAAMKRLTEQLNDQKYAKGNSFEDGALSNTKACSVMSRQYQRVLRSFPSLSNAEEEDQESANDYQEALRHLLHIMTEPDSEEKSKFMKLPNFKRQLAEAQQLFLTHVDDLAGPSAPRR